MKGVDFDENFKDCRMFNNHRMWCYRHHDLQVVKRPRDDDDGMKKKRVCYI